MATTSHASARRPVRAAALAAALALSLPVSARADDNASSEVSEAADYGWRPEWRRFEFWDYVGSVAALGLFYAVSSAPDPSEPRWDATLPGVDEPIRDLLVLSDRDDRERITRAGDYVRLYTILYPFLVSSIVPVVRGGDWRMAWDMNMMNLQSFAVNAVFQRGSHKVFGRTRPARAECARDPDYHPFCGRQWMHDSFLGGHVAVAMTGAGLTCAHHHYAELFGGNIADGLACATAVAAAQTVSVLRIMNDTHWTTDNLAGTALGLGAGLGLPALLHYRPFWWDGESASQARLMVFPLTSAAGVGAVGRF